MVSYVHEKFMMASFSRPMSTQTLKHLSREQCLFLYLVLTIVGLCTTEVFMKGISFFILEEATIFLKKRSMDPRLCSVYGRRKLGLI